MRMRKIGVDHNKEDNPQESCEGLEVDEDDCQGRWVRVGGTAPVLPPSQFRRLMVYDPKKMYRKWYPRQHEGCKGVVPSGN